MRWEEIKRAQAILSREQGTIYKDWGGKLRVALAYPNTYYVGMSSLALQTIYRAFNLRPTVVCERVFWDKGGLQAGRTLISLESQRPITDFDVFAFTISYEMDYFNVVEMLRQAGIPPLAQDRDETWPLLLGGGPALSMNPEPLAPFFDAIVIGEGEEVVGTLSDLLNEGLDWPRQTLLEQLATIPGVYVPQIHHNDPTQPDWHPIERLWVRDLTAHPTVSSLYTPDTEFSDLHLIEIARGCGRGCRFCLAGYVYRPPREIPAEVVLEWAREGLRYRDKIGLVSAAVSDHTEIDRLAEGLRRLGARISVSSMRTDPISVPLVELLAESGTQTLTIAPEAGSQRLRNVISKTQTDDDLLAAVDLAERLRFPQLKMYFMVGHPTETDADIQALVDFALEVRRRFSRRVVLNTTPYVPKAHTPFQWEPMTPAPILRERQEFVKRHLARHHIAVRADSPEWAEVQGILARGDRRLAQVLLRLERLSISAFHAAMAECGLSAAEYLGPRSPDEILPWQIVDPVVSPKYLQMEHRLAERGQPGRPCPIDSAGCLTCRACDPSWAFRFTGGVPARKPYVFTAAGQPAHPWRQPIPLIV
ncbi:MAG: radical SAM protein [Anaerolineae bacterium]|nr:radical SAM protein [Anaerolineae bacterium]MDW8100878.1 radical SAM protein [Anaerolineae bacterium]